MAKVTFTGVSRKAFNKVWKLSGRPTMDVIVPIVNWELPPGVVYDAHRDQFVNALKMDVQIDWRTQPATKLNFLPDMALHNVALELGGMMTSEGMNVVVLWSQSAQNAIANAWGVAISNKLYRVDRWELRPAGVPTPTDISVSLINAR